MSLEDAIALRSEQYGSDLPAHVLSCLQVLTRQSYVTFEDLREFTYQPLAFVLDFATEAWRRYQLEGGR